MISFTSPVANGPMALSPSNTLDRPGGSLSVARSDTSWSPDANHVVSPAPSADDAIGLLAEAVGQLKLAVSALSRLSGSSAGTAESGARATAPSSSPAARAQIDAQSQVEDQIAVTQDEISAYLASRRSGIFGTNGFAAYGDAAVPFSAGSFGQETSFFSDQTSEPEL